jgi:hypothetical protein
MPIGIIIDAASVALGGLVGSQLRKFLTSETIDQLNLVFGGCSMAIGVYSIALMANMPAVVLAIILGTLLGLFLRLGDRINTAAARAQRTISHIFPSSSTEDITPQLVTAIVLFCASGTGIYGAIVSGMTGEHSILITKAILDLFTAMIFACSMGPVVSFISMPQFLIFLLLFVCAKAIYPLTTPTMVSDFKACGGIIMLFTGFRMTKLRMFPLADMLPSMLIVMPISYLWTTYLIPLVGA